jgi:RNA polymerase sigma factor (sigma-70 family)
MSVDPTTAQPSRPSPGAAGARLGELYAEHARMVYGICRMLLRDPNEAEDATQVVFLSAYRNLLTGTEVRDPAAWLGTIARNACRQRAVSRMREPLSVPDDEITLVSPGVEETAIGREEAAALYAELGHLPDKQREAVVLRDLYGLRYDEVAKALGTSRPAVEALLFRGRRRLQRRLRPGFAAGVLVVPLAIQESIAYAVPGFASTAAPAGAAAAAVGVPLLAKLAAAGTAIGIAGSAGVIAERSVHDPPTRPAGTSIEHATPLSKTKRVEPAALLSVPPNGFAAAGRASNAGDPGHAATGDDGRQEREGERDEDADEARGETQHGSDDGDERGDSEQSRSGLGSGVGLEADDVDEPERAEPPEDVTPEVDEEDADDGER